MSEDQKRIIEIGGVKIEVDLRTAKRVDIFRVGDPVKVLIKNGSDYSIEPGVILEFVEFKSMPGIQVLHIHSHYSWEKPAFKLTTITAKSENMEIAPWNDYELAWSQAEMLEIMDKAIIKAQEEVRELRSKREAFVKYFGKAFQNEMVGQEEH